MRCTRLGSEPTCSSGRLRTISAAKPTRGSWTGSYPARSAALFVGRGPAAFGGPRSRTRGIARRAAHMDRTRRGGFPDREDVDDGRRSYHRSDLLPCARVRREAAEGADREAGEPSPAHTCFTRAPLTPVTGYSRRCRSDRCVRAASDALSQLSLPWGADANVRGCTTRIQLRSPRARSTPSPAESNDNRSVPP
jgi:hypothetical protein